MIVDFHAHLYPRAYMDEIAKRGAPYGVGLTINEKGLEILHFESIAFWAYLEDFRNVDARLNVLDKAGVDLQVLSMGPPMCYWADSKLAIDLCQIMNDSLAAVVAKHPNRFAALAALPLQDVPAAQDEIKRSTMSLGLRGVQMGTNINGKELDHPDLWPLYEQIEANDLPIFVHPINPLGQPNIHDYRLDLTVGFPFETTLAAARLIFGGVMEQFPKLKVCFAHLGGALPYLKDRLDIGWQARDVFPGRRTTIPKPPSEYIKNYYFDVVACSDSALQCAFDCVGADHLVVGSDAPFAVGDVKKSIDCVQRFGNATANEKSMILHKNALRLLKIDHQSKHDARAEGTDQ
jgi:aminocarboxymuconate-semialdehyde decarboxylase